MTRILLILLVNLSLATTSYGGIPWLARQFADNIPKTVEFVRGLLRETDKSTDIDLSALRKFLNKNGSLTKDEIQDIAEEIHANLDKKFLQKFFPEVNPDANTVDDILKNENFKNLLEEHDTRALIDSVLKEQNLAKVNRQAVEEIVAELDEVYKSVSSEDRLYLYKMTTTLDDGSVYDLLKVGKSTEKNVMNRVNSQVKSLQKLKDDLTDVTFSLPGKVDAIPVNEIEIKKVSIGEGKKMYGKLGFQVSDRDVHRILTEKGYEQVGGIPNLSGGESEEVFIKLGTKPEDFSPEKDISAALDEANNLSFRQRNNYSKTYIRGNVDRSVSLNIPDRQKAEVIFADIVANTESTYREEETKTKLAAILTEIKIRQSKHKDIDNELAEKFDDYLKALRDKEGFSKHIIKVNNGYEVTDDIKNLSDEVVIMRKMFSNFPEAIPRQAARMLGITGKHNTLKDHLNGSIVIDKQILTQMKVAVELRYGDNTELQKLLGELFRLRADDVDKDAVTDAAELLKDAIGGIDGMKALDAALKVNTNAGKFWKALADAALNGTDRNLLKETIIMRKMISILQSQSTQYVDPKVASRMLGIPGTNYAFVGHLRGDVDIAKHLDNDNMKTAMKKLEKDLEQEDYNKLLSYLEELEDIQAEKPPQVVDINARLQELFLEKKYSSNDENAIDEAIKLLKDAIGDEDGMTALDKALKEYNRAGKFWQALADAALNGTDRNLLKETIIMRKMISILQSQSTQYVDPIVASVASRMLGIPGMNYAFVGHLRGDVDIAKHLDNTEDAVKELIAKHGLKYGELLSYLEELRKIHPKKSTAALDEANNLSFRQRNNYSKTYIRGNVDRSVSLNIPDRQKAEVIFADIVANTESTYREEETKTKLAAILTEIKIRQSKHKDIDNELAEKFDDYLKALRDKEGFSKHIIKVNNGYEVTDDIKNLSDEVVIMRKMFSNFPEAIPRQAARMLGITGKHNTFKDHLNGSIVIDKQILTQMKVAVELRYGDNTELQKLLGELFRLRADDVDKDAVTDAAELLKDAIGDEDGMTALDKALKEYNRAGKFWQALADAALNGKDRNLLKETIIMRKMISILQSQSTQYVDPIVASRMLGIPGINYAFVGHLRGDVDIAKHLDNDNMKTAMKKLEKDLEQEDYNKLLSYLEELRKIHPKKSTAAKQLEIDLPKAG